MQHVSRSGCCDEDGCDKPAHARRMCHAHYSAWYRQTHRTKSDGYNVARRKPKEQRKCPVDGQPFEAGNNQRYCSKRCKKRVENAARYGWEPSSVPLPEPYDCANCGARCIPGENVAPHASRFCGYDCKAAWHSKYVEKPALRRATETRRANAERRRLMTWPPEITKAEAKRYAREVMRSDPCAYCGSPSQQLDHIIPRSEPDGVDDWFNRAGTCSSCNGRKQDVPLLFWMAWKLHHEEFEPWHQLRSALLTRTAV